ncbi:MAG: DUF4268 domain-containing protein [Flavobacteriales bacterium]|nr:DUF4268 domain-containing protein [Flavobacteriales bacterium]
MFLINQDTNRIEEIISKKFSELGFMEREHLQEWIANKPSSLGEELLIIQKEFDGFNDTKERLDLLALDKQGNLVIIENKLDDTGRDATWQVLKYASYCSSLNKTQILKIYQEYLDKTNDKQKAEEKISEFFDGQEIEEIALNKGQTQRLMLVAGEYRKEVTSTVLWLLNYNLRIQCFKTTPYKFGEQILLNIEQIIPMKEAEEFSIRMAEKTIEDISNQEELKTRHIVRQKFWTQLLSKMNDKSDSFQNISPSKATWIGTSSGTRGISYNFVATRKYCRVEVYIDRGDQIENKIFFDSLQSEETKIHEEFGNVLDWDKMEGKQGCRIKFEKSEVDIFNHEQWEEMFIFLTENMIKLISAFKEPMIALNKRIKNKRTFNLNK